MPLGTVKVNDDRKRPSNVFESLLRAGLFEEVLHGLRVPEERTIEQQARSAAELFSKLLQLGAL